MLRGIVVPLVTPFRKDGSICVDSVAALSEFLKFHVSAVVPCLTTGEGWMLSDKQWLEMVQCCLVHFGTERVIAGIELPTTEEAAVRAKIAADLGCRAVISTKPFGPSVTQQEIWDHYAALSAFTPLKVFIYNETWLSRNAMDAATLTRLAAIPQVVGIKESTGDPKMTSWLCKHKEQLPAIFQGREELLHASQNFEGFMVALANLAPEVCVRAFERPHQDVWEEVSALCHAHNLLSDNWIGEIKTELKRRGVITSSAMVADFGSSASACGAAAGHG